VGGFPEIADWQRSFPFEKEKHALLARGTAGYG
jgi:hypothetical protein